MGSVPVPISVTVLVLIAALALYGMWRGWVGRTKRSALLVPELPAIPADLGDARSQAFQVTYVSSTRAGDWLDRVSTQDLGARSAATAQVHDTGLMLSRVGAQSLFIPASHLVGTSLTPGMAGKFVGRDGIVVVTWHPAGPDSDLALDTGLFPAHKADRDVLQAAINELITPDVSTPAPTPDPNPRTDTPSSVPEPKEPK